MRITEIHTTFVMVALTELLANSRPEHQLVPVASDSTPHRRPQGSVLAIVQRLVDEGKNLWEIAEAAGLDTSHVCNYRDRHQIPIPRVYRSRKEYEAIEGSLLNAPGEQAAELFRSLDFDQCAILSKRKGASVITARKTAQKAGFRRPPQASYLFEDCINRQTAIPSSKKSDPRHPNSGKFFYLRRYEPDVIKAFFRDDSLVPFLRYPGELLLAYAQENGLTPALNARLVILAAEGHDYASRIVIVRQELQKREFATLYLQHGRTLSAQLQRLGCKVDLVPDLLQDTFFKAWRAYDSFDKNSSGAWLSRIARNVYFDHCRQQRTRQAVPIEALLESGFQPTAPQDTERDIEQAERSLELRALISKLDKRAQTVIFLREYYGYSYDEIAETLNTTRAAVKGLLHRAKEALRQLILDSTDRAFMEMAAKLLDQKADKEHQESQA